MISITDMTPKQQYQLWQEVQREKSRRSYTDYVECVHEGRWLRARHLEHICGQVQEFIEVETSKAYDIMILQMPPQHGKSMSITETLPSWYQGKHPDNRVILASYNDETAERFTRRNKDKIKVYGKAIFGIEISKKIDRATEYEIVGHQGRMISRGIMGGITSNPANLIIIDDPIKNRQEADSPTYRDRVWDEWQNSVKTRLAAGAKILLIMTRWHEDDLAGRIIANESNIKVINLPCEAEENDPLSRKPGQALFPEIGKGDEWLREFKRGYQSAEGSRAWYALFQGRPAIQEGNLINRAWWRYYTDLPEIVQLIMSVDAAFKGEETSDFTCLQVWGKRKADMYLIECINERMDFPAALRAIRSTKARYPLLRTVLVEDKANGSAIIQVLRRTIPGIIPVNPEGGKVARVNAVSPAIESGNVYLPQNAPWLGAFLDQCTNFPNAKNDDMVDAMSQALNRFIYSPAPVTGPEVRDDLGLFAQKEDDITAYINYGN